MSNPVSSKSFEIINEISKQIASKKYSTSDILAYIVRTTKKYFDYYHVNFYKLEGPLLITVEATGKEGLQMLRANRQIELNAKKSLVAYSARRKKMVLVKNVIKDRRWLYNPFLPETLCEASIPVIAGSKVIGVLDVQSSIIGGIKEKDTILLQAIANQLATFIDLKETNEELHVFQNQLSELVNERTKDLLDEIERRNEVERNLKKANKITRDSLNIKNTFLTHVSHELRTPIHAIIGLSDIIINSEVKILPQFKKHIRGINIAAENLLTTINEVLDLSQIESGRMSINKEAFSLYNMIDKIEKIIFNLAEEKKLQLKFDLDKNLPEFIISDEQKLKQILINLLQNAIKFTEKGSIYTKISLLDKNLLKISVKDTGIGIAKKDYNKIFNSFTRIKNNSLKKYPSGTGIGLYVVKTLANLLQGNITVSSKLKYGSKFVLTIPIEVSNTPVRTMGVKTPKYSKRQTLKVIIAEDNDLNMLIINNMANRLGLKGINATNGKEVIDQLKSHKKISGLILDLQMPVMDGYETLEYIREKMNIDKTKLPIFIVTANASKEVINKTAKYGITDYIIKPFRAEEFYEKLTKVFV